MDPNKLMFELSHPDRVRMLNILEERSMRMTELAKNLEMNTAEVSRHLSRLSENSIVEKMADGMYAITPFGRLAVTNRSVMDYFAENIEFFQGHDISPIPLHLLSMPAMALGYFRKGTLKNMKKAIESSNMAKEFIYIIGQELMEQIIEMDCAKIDEGIEVKKIYPKGLRLPEAYTSRFSDRFQVRVLDEVNLSLKMMENLGAIALPTTAGKVDYDIVIERYTEPMLTWFRTLFDYYWERATPYGQV
jgi:predicted transcriptional regulator